MSVDRDQRKILLSNFDPAAAQADLGGLVERFTKTARVAGTNAAALGIGDVYSVDAIYAFVTATGAPAAQMLLDPVTDYTVDVPNKDVVAVGDHSLETWVVHYRI